MADSTWYRVRIGHNCTLFLRGTNATYASGPAGACREVSFNLSHLPGVRTGPGWPIGNFSGGVDQQQLNVQCIEL
jgi:hypothetical protein